MANESRAVEPSARVVVPEESLIEAHWREGYGKLPLQPR